MADHTVRVDNGKYTFIGKPLAVAIHRYGEPWHIQTEATNALRSMMAELDAARVVLEAARKVVNTPRGDTRQLVESIDTIADAIAKHDRLVDDHEPPSEWCL